MGKKRFNLILGFSGPYGAGSSSLFNELQIVLKDWQGVIVRPIKVTDLLLNYGQEHFEIDVEKLKKLKRHDYRKEMQALGTKIRKIDNELVGKIIVKEICRQGIEVEDQLDGNESSNIIFLIDSIKNTNECKLLKRVYGDEFQMAFIHLNSDTRWKRLISHNYWEKDKRTAFDECDEVDRDEAERKPDVKDSGQQVRKIAQYADYFIVNNNNLEALKNEGVRWLRLLFGENTVLPTLQESSMHVAFSAASRSFCLSRQVGAALVGPKGEVFAIGHNDVPKASGGLYKAEDQDFDQRCYINGRRNCMNDLKKRNLFQELGDGILKITEEAEIQIPDEVKNKIRDVIKNSEFKRATEYCKAVHAEMNCLLSGLGKVSIDLATCTLYVTTQPCHNCTKHILSAGIMQVVFIEPYPKSLSQEFHGEAILFDPENDEIGVNRRKLLIVPYAGVSPRKYSEYFNRIGEIKEDGLLIRQTREKLASQPAYARRIEPRSRNNEKDEWISAISKNELEIASKVEVESTAPKSTEEPANETTKETTDDRSSTNKDCSGSHDESQP